MVNLSNCASGLASTVLLAVPMVSSKGGLYSYGISLIKQVLTLNNDLIIQNNRLDTTGEYINIVQKKALDSCEPRAQIAKIESLNWLIKVTAAIQVMAAILAETVRLFEALD